jgi:FkbM family methyltransferase
MTWPDYLRRQYRIVRGRDLPFWPTVRKKPERFGSGYGGWSVLTDDLTSQSIIYAVGIGEDLSFDLALIQRFGCTVHAFDPTPQSLAWVARQDLPPTLHVHAWGLSGSDGPVQFFMPASAGHVSHSIADTGTGQAITVEMKTLHTTLRELGHTSVDVLKLDVEGAEYAIIEQLVQQPVAVRQLLVEYHHGLYPTIRLEDTRQSVNRLLQAGWQIFDISPLGREYHFVFNG